METKMEDKYKNLYNPLTRDEDKYKNLYNLLTRGEDTPKRWCDMAPEERGALLLADHEGKVIECLSAKDTGGWIHTPHPVWQENLSYRVKPESKIQVVTLQRKWTPGPWEFDGDAVVNHKGFIVADKGNTNWRNNAHMVAAAPDLYEALEMAAIWLDADGRFGMQGINSALAKARGEL